MRRYQDLHHRQLRVGVNGNTGVFYLHPKLEYSNGDQGDSFNPAYSSADLEVGFPGRYLRPGANTITLQLVEEAEEAVPDAGINYDAIELDSVAPKADSQPISADLVPTVFFQHLNGKLAEAVDAFIRYDAPVKPGSSVNLTIGNSHYRADIRGGHDFGEERIQFLVSEFAPQALREPHPLSRPPCPVGRLAWASAHFLMLYRG